MDPTTGKTWDEPSLFDEAGMIAAREDGIERSYTHRTDAWKTAAREAVALCVAHYDTFTTDEVIDILEEWGVEAENLMGLGAVMRQAAKDGWIVNTRTVRRSRIARRHRDLTVWRSNL